MAVKFENYIAALLATYMFALMLLPCNDTCNSQYHKSPTTIHAAQQHHKTDSDICSPFCFCACCSTAMNIQNFSTFSFNPQLSKQNFLMLELAFVSKSNNTIWQPPKLASNF